MPHPRQEARYKRAKASNGHAAETAGLGAFAREFASAHAAGLVVIPTRSDDAKRPMWKNWSARKNQPRLSTLKRFADDNPDANWGYVPGASSLVVVDVDQRDHLDQAEATWGKTPLLIETGKKGFHLPYRHEGGIASLDLRHTAGLPVEIKSNRTLVVGYGSVHPETGRRYQIVRGTHEDFARLPAFNIAALERLIGRAANEHEELRAPSVNESGTRNRGTFAHLRAIGAAGIFTGLDDVLAEAQSYNGAHNNPPLSEDEIVRTCRKVWGYITEGKCRAPKRARSYSAPTKSELATLRETDTNLYDYADALALFVELKSAHGARAVRGETFAIAASAMAQSAVIPGWSDRKRYMKAVNALMSVKLITKQTGVVLEKWTGTDGKRRAKGRQAAQYSFNFGGKDERH